MSLSIVEATTNNITTARSAAVNNLAQGSAIIWLNIDVIDDDVHEVWLKGPGDTIQLRKQASTNPTAPNGLRFNVSRAVSGQQVFIANADISAGAWLCVVTTWDITNGGPQSYVGDLTTPLADTTLSPADGSGAKNDDSGNDIVVGDSGSSLTLGFDVARFMIFNTDLSLAQAETQRLNPDPEHANLVQWNEFGLFPPNTNTQRDLKGANVHTGTVTGATRVAHPVELVAPFKRYELING